ncbi:MAG TPA: ABC transporter ATP-binding protein [Solirubrobacterales bacterium]|nr:ABC transporter ATP-binding protein [Solirubrobacterales bacterium]
MIGLASRRQQKQVDPALQPRQGSILSLRGVTARYGATTAIREVSIDVMPGEIVTILGANGAGKTTTLGSVMGLVPPAEGHIYFEGEDIAGRSPESIVDRGVALSPEGRRIFGKLTVEENLRIGAGVKGQRQVRERIDEVVDLFPVVGRKRDDFAGLLSGGEQQMLAIGRALMSGPRLLLLDEPSLGLAPIVVSTVFELIEKLRQRGITVVLVEQNVDRALRIADRGYVLSTGRVQLSAEAAELRQGSAVEDAYLGLGVPTK